MKPIKWKEGEDYLWKSLGIEEERAEELEHRFKLILREAMRPVKKGEQSPTSDVIIKMFIALAKTQEELILCSFVAGSHVNNLFDDEDEDYEEFKVYDDDGQ